MNKNLKTVLVLIIALIGISTTVGAATIFNSRDITYSSDQTTKTNVKDALDELYTNLGKCPKGQYCYTEALGLSDKVELGDYISMTPTSTSYMISKNLTGYTSDQTINPSELNLWRIIKKNDDGSIDVVSHFVSTNEIYLYGEVGYLNTVGVLNLIAAQYTNSKYVTKTRHMGYYQQEEFCKSLTECPVNDQDIIDTQYIKNAIGSLLARTSAGSQVNVWKAHRYRETKNGNIVNYCVSVTDWNIENSGRALVSNGKGENWSASIRPIITLKSNLKIISGDGKSAETAYRFE